MAADPWQRLILDATKEGSVCIQHNYRVTAPVEGEEDCLHLNIYTHSVNAIYMHIATYTFKTFSNAVLKKLNFSPNQKRDF